MSIRKCQDYELGQVSSVLSKVLDDLGGLGVHIRAGDRVLLKPNLLMSAPPEKAIVTHPVVMEALACMVLDCRGKPFIGDSPPFGHLSKVLTKSGYDPFMRRLEVQAVPFSERLTIEFPESRIFRRIELAKEVFDFDMVLNIAKLKTHCQMLLTLSVKNLFGTVIGSDKVSWHLRAGRDTDSFATVLVQIYEKVRPAVSIIDGILAMEGNGPNNGSPRHLGVLMGSTDGIALDATVCKLVGYPVNALRTSYLGDRMGIGTTNPCHVKVLGDDLEGFPLRDFVPPKSINVVWNLSHWNPVRRFLENHVVTRPVIDPAVCKTCGVCLEHCPPQAISKKNQTMVIDKSKCISCFCCHELCIHGAVKIVQPRLGKFLGSLTR